VGGDQEISSGHRGIEQEVRRSGDQEDLFQREEVLLQRGNACSSGIDPFSWTPETAHHGLLRQAQRVTFAFIQAEKADHRVRVLCQTLGVSVSGFIKTKER